MSDTIDLLQRKIRSARDLMSVVHTMKTLAASSIGRYERAVQSLEDYHRSIELGLSVCFRDKAAGASVDETQDQRGNRTIGAVVFGSDQGLVGRFNEAIAQLAVSTLSGAGAKLRVWAVGERVLQQLNDAKLDAVGPLRVPTSCEAITPLVGQILLECAECFRCGEISELSLFYNRAVRQAIYVPCELRVLPIDAAFRIKLKERAWETKCIPEVLGPPLSTLQALIGEYVFVVLFRAAAESLASENAARLSAMQRAEKNIDEMLDVLYATYHQLRQSGIDAELFDVVSGFEALEKASTAFNGTSNLSRRAEK